MPFNFLNWYARTRAKGLREMGNNNLADFAGAIARSFRSVFPDHVVDGPIGLRIEQSGQEDGFDRIRIIVFRGQLAPVVGDLTHADHVATVDLLAGGPQGAVRVGKVVANPRIVGCADAVALALVRVADDERVVLHSYLRRNEADQESSDPFVRQPHVIRPRSPIKPNWIQRPRFFGRATKREFACMLGILMVMVLTVQWGDFIRIMGGNGPDKQLKLADIAAVDEKTCSPRSDLVDAQVGGIHLMGVIHTADFFRGQNGCLLRRSIEQSERVLLEWEPAGGGDYFRVLAAYAHQLGKPVLWIDPQESGGWILGMNWGLSLNGPIVAALMFFAYYRSRHGRPGLAQGE